MIGFFLRGISFFLQLLALHLLGTAALALAVMFFPEMESHLDFEPNHEMIPIVAAFSALAGLFVGWLSLAIVRKKKKKPLAPGSAKASDQWEPPSIEELVKARDEINERFDRAEGPASVAFSYETKEKFFFQGENGRWGNVKVELSALIERTLETMTVQEREVLRIIEMLAAIGVPSMEDQIRMWRAAIIWGDGKARIKRLTYEFNRMWGKSEGLGNWTAIIQWAMKKNNLSFHTVRDEVVDLVSEAWKGADKDHPILSDIMRRLRGGQAWA